MSALAVGVEAHEQLASTGFDELAALKTQAHPVNLRLAHLPP
jgi:hypothetical protein